MAYAQVARRLAGSNPSLRKVHYLVIAAVLVEIGLIVLYLMTHSSEHDRLQRFFHLDREANLPTWFSSMQLFVIGIVAMAAARFAQPLRNGLQWQLFLFAGVFIFLSMDEAATFHETIGIGAVKFQLPYLPSFNSQGAWIIPYLALALVFLWLVRGSIIWIMRHDPLIIMTAGAGFALYLVGAAGLELTSFYTDRDSLYGLFEVSAEEGFEMLGGTLILYAMIRLYLGLETLDRPRA